ncbi:uncharacterized protein LOC132269932 [Cornus florida]|uniref:uncharacterized protein LOC132269932 n=1 Tax=Cornus florida TaxID=4283 RepID=UPI0028A072E7|nr:uncharacterized protein LOC132269932 [Cornus florida]
MKAVSESDLATSFPTSINKVKPMKGVKLRKKKLYKKSVATGPQRANDSIERESLWGDIARHVSTLSSAPCLLGGDFNIILSDSENFGGSTKTTKAMLDFRDCLHQSNLEDLKYTGIFHSWSNKSEGVANISKKLDRVLINDSWTHSFPLSYCNFLPLGISDHSLMIISLGNPAPPRKVPFRFFNCWSNNDSFLPLIQSIWDEPVAGFTMFQVVTKLKNLQQPLKKNFSTNFSAIKLEVQHAHDLLSQCQAALDIKPDDSSLRSQEKQLIALYSLLRNSEEQTYRQKSRVLWLKEGDSNSSFFFKSIASRVNRNKTTTINSANGDLLDTDSAIKKEIVSHFQSTLGLNPHPYPGMAPLSSFIQPTVPPQFISSLCSIPSNEEIKNYDLMLFSYGNLESLSSLKQAIDTFSSLSGLQINKNKSHVFLSGVNDSLEAAILALLGFEKGALPVRYIGVPFVSTMLRSTDCRSLIDRITLRIGHWTSKNLSFAGRLQLIRSILFSTQMYWSSKFILPASITHELESIFGAFLWTGPILRTSGAKIAWDKCCLPKRPSTWNDLINWASHHWKGNSQFHSNSVSKLSLAALVYNIWIERNNRIFQKKYQSAKSILHITLDSIRSKLLNSSITDASVASRVAAKWELPESVIRPSAKPPDRRN